MGLGIGALARKLDRKNCRGCDLHRLSGPAGLWGGLVSYAVIAGSIMAAILFAWALGLWRASWFVRIIAAFICVIVTSWPFAALVVFSACYFGPCRFP